MLRGQHSIWFQRGHSTRQLGDGEFISLPGPSWLWTRESLNSVEQSGKEMKGKSKDLEALFSILMGKMTKLRLCRIRKMPWDRRHIRHLIRR